LSKLGEIEADEFFKDGDEGTYGGGPGDSLPAGTIDLLADEPPVLRTLAQIERRARYKRLVTTVVSTLGVGSMLLFAIRFSGSHGEEPAPAAASGGITRGAPAAQSNALVAVATQAPLPEPPQLAVAPAPTEPAIVVAEPAAVAAAVEPPVVVEPAAVAAAVEPPVVAEPAAVAVEPRPVVPAAQVAPVAAKPKPVAVAQTGATTRTSAPSARPGAGGGTMTPQRAQVVVVVRPAVAATSAHAPPSVSFPD